MGETETSDKPVVNGGAAEEFLGISGDTSEPTEGQARIRSALAALLLGESPEHGDSAAEGQPPTRLQNENPPVSLEGEEEEREFDASIAALHSAKTWEELGLPDELLKAVYAKGFNRPSRIQEKAIPLILGSGRNVVAQAHNGSGKTAAFALCMLAKIDKRIMTPQAVCVCHTRELARQNVDVIRELGKFSEITCWLCVPQGEFYDQQIGAQIVVGTPGKIREMLMKRVFRTDTVKIFVVDEADLMMDHLSTMGGQVAQIRKQFRDPLQILLFSATYPERVQKFVETHVPGAHRLEIRKEELTISAIQQFYVECESDAEKFEVLSDLYACLTIGQSIIFVNTRRLGFDLAKKMTQEGHAVSLICGTQASGGRGNASDTMDHETRERIMAEFRNGETKVLIATDLLSRGVDVPQVTLVVNYNLPSTREDWNLADTETYIHRIGRTGRFGLKGIAISLIDARERKFIEQVERFYQCHILPLGKGLESLEEMVRKLRE